MTSERKILTDIPPKIERDQIFALVSKEWFLEESRLAQWNLPGQGMVFDVGKSTEGINMS
jgi:hypothetical protein